LEELSKQKNQNNRHAEDVRETLQWLDEVTTKYPDVVALQGADETFENWEEVEKFAVPRTLFSEHDEYELESEPDANSAGIPDKLAFEHGYGGDARSTGSSMQSRPGTPASQMSFSNAPSPTSPPTSPARAPAQNSQTKSTPPPNVRPTCSDEAVPRSIQSLFNYILWRVHQELDPVAALESFIFLCNDANKLKFAKGFDIKVKRLEQLREAVGREDREYKNRQAVLNRESRQEIPPSVTSSQQLEKSVEAVPRMISSPKAPSTVVHADKSPVIDPNAFSRSAAVAKADVVNGEPRSPRLNPTPSAPGSPRARPSTPRGAGRGSNRGSLRGNPRGRGPVNNSGGGRAGHTMFDSIDSIDSVSQAGQIDPNSFSRPSARGGISTSRGGAGRKLWVPT
jgi:hypothetical protein